MLSDWLRHWLFRDSDQPISPGSRDRHHNHLLETQDDAECEKWSSGDARSCAFLLTIGALTPHPGGAAHNNPGATSVQQDPGLHDETADGLDRETPGGTMVLEVREMRYANRLVRWSSPLWVAVLALAAYGAGDAVLLVRDDTGPGVSGGREEIIIRGPWGSGLAEFGKLDEASRPGPMDFALRGDSLYILDSVNSRVQVFGLDGAHRGEIPVGTSTADFLCVDDKGQLTILDAFVRREISTFSAVGELLTSARLPQSMGLPSAIFADGDRVWVEERHSRVYELNLDAGRSGAVASVANALSGRPVNSAQRTVHARKNGSREVVLRVTAAETASESWTLKFPRELASIVALEADDVGRVYLAAACRRGADAGRWETDIVLAVISPGGDILASICMPNAYTTDHYRKLLVSPSGDVIQMQTDETEVRFVRWLIPPLPTEEVSP